MKPKTNFPSRQLALFLVFTFCVLLAAGCSGGAGTRERNSDAAIKLDTGQAVVITGDGVSKETRLTLEEMLKLPGARVEQVYSTINNWPAPKKYAAKGVKLTALLETAGLKPGARGITVKGKDDFQWSFTREQLLDTPRYYYPEVQSGDPSGAVPVEPIIAYAYKENSDNPDEAGADGLCLIMPQADVWEQTNLAFVKGVREIQVVAEDPGKWEKAGVYPRAGTIAGGDTVKLQHKDLGKVKMYYTLDGSTPTGASMIYNPSTYQPELNKPIRIDKDTTIKVLVRGFGKHDSDIAEFHYKIKGS
jgi:hypothetical protein